MTPFYDTDFGVNLRYQSKEPLQLSSYNLLVLLFEQGLMRPMTVRELPPNIIPRNDFTDLRFSERFCVRKPALDPAQTLPAESWNSFAEHCLQNHNVLEIGGIVKSFCTKAARGARNFATRGRYQQLVLLDVSSLYPTAMSRLEMATGEPNIWNADVDLMKTSQFVVKIDIFNIGKPNWMYPYLTCGYRFVDNIELEDLVRYCKIEYRIASGYYWLDSDDSNREYIKNLFEQRLNAITQEEKTKIKAKMNVIYGKALRKSFKTSKRRRFGDAGVKERWGNN
jgi:hypothetical protein